MNNYVFVDTVFFLKNCSLSCYDIHIGVGGLGFKSQVGQIKHCLQRFAAAATFLGAV